jgi:hypothetical protein
MPLLDGKGGREWLSESESELATKGSKEFVAGLLLRWEKDWAEDNMGPSACEEWMGGDGWRTLLRRNCPWMEEFLAARLSFGALV